MKDYISELKEMKQISDISQEIIMLTYSPQYVDLIVRETDKIFTSNENKDKFMHFVEKCFKIFESDDFEYMLPVLTCATLNLLAREEENNEQTDEPTKMFG